MHICSEGIINADLASKLGVCLMDLFFRYACILAAYIIHMLMMLFSNNFAKCWLALGTAARVLLFSHLPQIIR